MKEIEESIKNSQQIAKESSILVDSAISKAYNQDGLVNPGEIAKALATTNNWNLSYETGAVGNYDYSDIRNATGFSAISAGGCIFNQFEPVGDYAFWWS